MSAVRYLQDVRGTLRQMRSDLEDQDAPEPDASPSEHAWYVLGQILAWMLSPWYWLVVLVIAAVAFVVSL